MSSDHDKEFILVQVYIDDIIFGATNDLLCNQFFNLMQKELKMGLIGELRFFLGLQIKQPNRKILVHQSKYVKELLKKFGLVNFKSMSIPMHLITSLGLQKESKPT